MDAVVRFGVRDMGSAGMCRVEVGKCDRVLRARQGQEWREKFGDKVVVVVGDDPDDPRYVAVREDCGEIATLSREDLNSAYVLL